MDIGFDILLFIHLAALVIGGATTVAMPLIARQMQLAPPKARAGYGAIAQRLGLNSRLAVGALILSGIAMVVVRYGGVEGLGAWFWIKMALVAVLVAAIVAGAVLGPKRASPRVFGWITRLALIGVVLSAVFAFN